MKIGRNDPCPCGSGKKYKKCHGGVKMEQPILGENSPRDTREIQLVISFYPGTGNVQVHGPIQDKILSFGLLKIAETIIANLKPEDNKIVVPNLVSVDNLKEFKKPS